MGQIYSQHKLHAEKQFVMIETPYSGDIDRNVRFLLLSMADSALLHNEVPYASHVYMTQHPRCRSFYVSDYDKKWNVWTRESGIEASQVIRRRCDKTVFYDNKEWSRGMMSAKMYCIMNGLPYETRSLNTQELSKRIPFLSMDFCNAVVSKNLDYTKFLE